MKTTQPKNEVFYFCFLVNPALVPTLGGGAGNLSVACWKQDPDIDPSFTILDTEIWDESNYKSSLLMEWAHT